MKKKKSKNTDYKYKDIDLKLVERYAAFGYRLEYIALLLDVNKDTLNEWKKGKPEFAKVLRSGKLKADSLVINALLNKAQNGDTIAMIFWLKNRLPEYWRDRIDHKVGGDKDNPLNLHLFAVDVINKLDKDLPPPKPLPSPVRLIKETDDKDLNRKN